MFFHLIPKRKKNNNNFVPYEIFPPFHTSRKKKNKKSLRNLCHSTPFYTGK